MPSKCDRLPHRAQVRTESGHGVETASGHGTHGSLIPTRTPRPNRIAHKPGVCEVRMPAVRVAGGALELLHHVHQLSRRERRAVRVLDVEQESRRQLALVLRRRGNVLEERVLPPPAVVLPLVRVEGEQHEQREHQERDHGLPHVDNVGRRHHEDDDQPEVRPNGKGCGDGVHSHVGDLAAVVRGNRLNADRNDDEEIEGGGADDGGRAELAGEAIVRQQLDDGEQDLGR
eukprot:960406-Prymnesium_polylepis.3